MDKILTAVGEKKALMQIFNKSHVTIRRALKGETKTPLALKIRKAAIERGAVAQPKKQTIKK